MDLLLERNGNEISNLSLFSNLEQSLHTIVGDQCMKNNGLAILIAITVFNSGCINSTSAENSASEFPFYEVAKGASTDYGTYTAKQIRVIQTQSEYNEILSQYISSPPESLDFETGAVLLVDMGLRSTGGYSVQVSSIDEADEYVIANITLSVPGNCHVVSMALTNPYQFVFVPTKKEILVTESILDTCKT